MAFVVGNPTVRFWACVRPVMSPHSVAIALLCAYPVPVERRAQAATGVLLAVSSLPDQTRRCRYGTRPAEELELKNAPWLCMIALAGAFAGHAEAIYKCTTPKGVIYQDRPCREGTETDVQIVVPTGELAPNVDPTQDEAARANGARVEGRFGGRKQGRAGDDAISGGATGARQGVTRAPRPAATNPGRATPAGSSRNRCR